MTGTLIGVGTGPGDPDLITVKGRDALLRADRIFVPVAVSSPSDKPGYAERVVTHHVPHDLPIIRLVFELARGHRDMSWARAADTVADVVAADGTAAFATIGDPNVYSTFTYLARAVRRLVPDAAVETIPGITAMQDLAARTGTVLGEDDEPLTLMPITAGTDRVESAQHLQPPASGALGGEQERGELVEREHAMPSQEFDHLEVPGGEPAQHRREELGSDVFVSDH
jgi:precorrin-2/cobalt-factor-2 C20-methyltransferase